MITVDDMSIGCHALVVQFLRYKGNVGCTSWVEIFENIVTSSIVEFEEP